MDSVRLIARSLAALSLLSVCSLLCAQRSVSSADGRIVTSATAVQEDEALAAGMASPETAWSMLTTAVTDGKLPETRIQALAALGTMGSNPRATRLIEAGMKDSDLDVRTAAILAAAQTGNPRLIPSIRAALNDPEPQVAFAAAVTLWKLHNHSGAALLTAVMEGDRKATPGLIHGARHDMSKELHDPGALTRLGVTESASLLLGPFGFGVKAIEYAAKNGASSPRATAIDLLATDRSAATRTEFLDALTDKDPAVRAAAAKALGERHQASLAKPIGSLFQDKKLPVRLTAAAAYLNSVGRYPVRRRS